MPSPQNRLRTYCATWRPSPFSLMTFSEATQYLDERGIPYRLHKHEGVRTVRDVEAELPHLLPTMVKSIAFRLKEGDLILAVVRGADRVDYKKLAGLLDVSRRAVRALSPQEVVAQLGVEPGGVTPLPLNGARVFVDEGVVGLETMHAGSGLPTVTLEMRPGEYVAGSGVAVASIVRSG